MSNRINIIKDCKGSMFISLNNKKPKDLMFNRDTESVKGRIVGTSRPLNVKDVNRVFNYVANGINDLDLGRLNELIEFLNDLILRCNEDEVDYDLPEQVVHILNSPVQRSF